MQKLNNSEINSKSNRKAEMFPTYPTVFCLVSAISFTESVSSPSLRT